MVRRLTLIGFGEAAQTFSGDSKWRGEAAAYDKLTDDPATRDAKHADYARLTVQGHDHPAAALSQAELVLSLVTADEALAAAKACAKSLRGGPVFCDMNSVSPGTKAAASEAINQAGGHYVDVAIMAPVLPARLNVPLLVSGPKADEARLQLVELGFANVRSVGPRVGQASAIKMMRSVIVKGIEALTAEAMQGAHAAGVTDEVLASLDLSEKRQCWSERADYNLERMMVHGERRAAEMDEAAKTLEDLGVEPLMARATARRQKEIGRLHAGACPEGLAEKIELIRHTAGRMA